MKRNYIVYLVVLMFINSCNWDPSYKDERDWSAWEQESASLTDIEYKFQDSLRNAGFETHLEHGCIGRMGEEEIIYNVEVMTDGLTVTETNCDSLENFRTEIANKLYSSVIQDSVLYDMSQIGVKFGGIKYQLGIDHNKFRFHGYYSKDSLEKWNNFEVKKTGQNRYKRIPVN
jgi:hypothetical protein